MQNPVVSLGSHALNGHDAAAHGVRGFRHFLALAFAFLQNIFFRTGTLTPQLDDILRDYGRRSGVQRRKPRLKLCLAASGGGHLRQLLDLQPFWQAHDYFFVTEPTSLGHSVADQCTTEFVPHFALGQARLGAPLKMLLAATRGLFRSYAIIARHKPDLVVTTGAGSMFFIVVWARLFGARIVVIDSFARFQAPSTFARIMGPMADKRIAQSQRVAKSWGTPFAFDPFRILDQDRPEKERLLFATVGATLPFDRLVDAVIEAKRAGHIPEDVIIQTGDRMKRISGMDGVRAYNSLSFSQCKDLLRRADFVVCHGGTGSLITALQNHCRVIAFPRLFTLSEHYDDHQLEVTRNLQALGLVEVVDMETDFITALKSARASTPRAATMDVTALTGFLNAYADQVARERARTAA